MRPKWKQPNGSNQLKLYNSLTKEKNDFVPESGGKRVLWYNCGPTVYDASHMGHARSYITFDILRRVIVDYFNFDVFYCMNITDIDDKIINRARRNYLVNEYIRNKHPSEKILSDLDQAIQLYQEKFEKTTDVDKKSMMSRILNEVHSQKEVFLGELSKNTSGEELDKHVGMLLCKSFDPLSDLLDKAFGAGITDHAIFSALPQRWEKEFHDDMAALNILPADVLTRVSQYVPEIVTYIEKIINNGYAYASNGSVYFDTMKFATTENNQYAKLVPEAVGDLTVLAEGEGALVGDTGEKKSDRDFALWKASKPGEPSWDSPWGKGRPGWHIECSVMASDVFNGVIDIHTGGVDLKFPHHDNEIAQAEAYYGCDQWINYFLHSGHLTIEGCKMSKSLKNFVSIKDALKINTSRQIRLAFLLHTWHATLDFSQNVLKEAEQMEKLFNDFFLSVKDIMRKPSGETSTAHDYREAEKELQNNFFQKKDEIHEALCDSIDTPTAMQLMQTLVKQGNIYIGQCKQAERIPNHSVLKGIAKYLTDMLRLFGANEGQQEIGFGSSASSTETDNETALMPFVNLIADFREDVRSIARQEKVGKILDLCDDYRDYKLVDIGVKLEDQEGGLAPIVKLVDKETLIKEREMKFAAIEEKRKEKEIAKAKQMLEQANKEAKAKVPPSEMFRNEVDKYSKFDENGIPTHDASGEPISGAQIKKMKKAYNQQEKLYQKYLSTSNGMSGGS